MRHSVAVVGLAVLLSAMCAPAAMGAGGGCGEWSTCETNEEEVVVGSLSREEVLALPLYPNGRGAVPVADPNRQVYEYATLPDCSDAVPGTPTEEAMCSRALRSCPPETVGPLSMIWRRTMQAGRQIEPWNRVGNTCHTDVAPGARPSLTMADIKAQFMRTPWAKPQLSSQPAGNTTLVNLTTFYAVTWTRAGFEPGEVDSGSIRGFTVRIRPRLVGFTYVFGDGSTFGPTTSTGGTYPDGDVTHIYAKPGAHAVRVDTTFGADFSVDGSTWDPIPSTVTVAGPTTTLTVREAKAVLVQR